MSLEQKRLDAQPKPRSPEKTDGAPYVSIIVPCRNEKRFIRECVESILVNDYPIDKMEILVIDGMSTDGTREILDELAARHCAVRVVDNPKMTTPTALNIGIDEAQGEIIIRMDAHTHYPDTYVTSLVAWLEKTEADNVGGLSITRPANESVMARAIAAGLSHPFGVGNAHFRIGSGEEEPRWVDTVPFGCYRREVFERFGRFDEDLLRNQDDEFNHRLIRGGGRILLVPQITCYYYPRASLSSLWRMYYGYGYFKPLAAKKIGRVMTVRQLVPSAFVLTTGVLTLLATFSWHALLALLVVMCLYVLATVAASLAVSIRERSSWGASLLVVFPAIHFSYGLGFLRGFLDFILLKRSVSDKTRRRLTRPG